MNLQRIQYFLTFCETMHFTNAARKLRISQPALTKSIGLLEKELGTRLVRREGKHTHLTQHGISARKRYTELMALITQVDEEIKKTLNDGADQIRIAVLSSLNFTPFTHFLYAFHRQHSKVHIDIIDCAEHKCEELLLNGDVDCLLTTNCESLHDRVVCLELYESALVIIGKNQISNANTFAHIQTQIENRASQPVPINNQIFNHKDNQFNAMVHCTQQLWVQQLVKAGIGVSVSPVCTSNIEEIDAANADSIIERQTVSAAIPTGRNDSEIFRRFVNMLKMHDWQ